MKGKLIVLEGVEGAGKSYQCGRLADALRARGMSVVLTREPGGVPLAEKLRSLILTREYAPDALTELFMYEAARREHLNKVIAPALRAGQIVICDRFFYSTVAYQGYGRGLDVDFIRRVNAVTVSPIAVDLALFLDIPPEAGFKRKGGADSSDRLESESMEFFYRIYNGFIAMCDAGELVRIDASGSAQTVFDCIMRETEGIL